MHTSFILKILAFIHILKISTEESIGDLKEAIKKKKENDFDKVDADKLILHHVSLTINDDDEEKPITLQGQPNAKKLRATSEISEVFATTPPKKTIHIIVQRPSTAEQVDSLQVAMLRKQLSDMTGIVDGISSKPTKDSYPWTTDLQTTALQEFKSALIKISPQHASDPYLEVFSYEGNASTSKYQIIRDDHHLRAILSISKKSRASKLFISLACPSKSYSAWTFDEVCAEYKLSLLSKPPISVIPLFDGVEAAPLDSAEAIKLKDELTVEVVKRNSALKGVHLNEASRSLVVGSYLIAATELFKEDLVLDVEREIKGRRGHGKVDYSVHSRKSNSTLDYTLGATEVKKEDIQQGFAQNIVQLESALLARDY
ncbi:hypothetical protein BGX27_000549 [Mortierella sp. AM989]|nr:hypothetical protein BGX27_000549 [Mortierella sp. AM989]